MKKRQFLLSMFCLTVLMLVSGINVFAVPVAAMHPNPDTASWWSNIVDGVIYYATHIRIY